MENNNDTISDKKEINDQKNLNPMKKYNTKKCKETYYELIRRIIYNFIILSIVPIFILVFIISWSLSGKGVESFIFSFVVVGIFYISIFSIVGILYLFYFIIKNIQKDCLKILNYPTETEKENLIEIEEKDEFKQEFGEK